MSSLIATGDYSAPPTPLKPNPKGQPESALRIGENYMVYRYFKGSESSYWAMHLMTWDGESFVNTNPDLLSLPVEQVREQCDRICVYSGVADFEHEILFGERAKESLNAA